MALTRKELDAMRCSNPDCTEDHGPLYFHSNCHPAGRLEAYYENGILVFDCMECRKRITSVEVAA